MFLEIDGRQVFAVDAGRGEVPVVLHSGWIGTWEDWLPQVEALSRVTRVVAYDHRGAGRSPCAPEAITLDALVADLVGVLDAAGIDRCVVGGFSSGSSVVLEALNRVPARFLGCILMCPVDPDPDPRFMALLARDFDAAMHAFLDLCLPEAAERDVASVRRWAWDVLHQSGPDEAARLMEVLRAPPDRATRRPSTVPGAIVVGAADPMSDASTLPRWQALLPQAPATVVPDAGHLAAFTAAHAVNAPMLELVSGLHTQVAECRAPSCG